jgi:hypothetical protein
MPAQVLYHLWFFAKLDLWLLTRKQRLWQLNEKKVDKFLKRLRAKHPTVCHGAHLHRGCYSRFCAIWAWSLRRGNRLQPALQNVWQTNIVCF